MRRDVVALSIAAVLAIPAYALAPTPGVAREPIDLAAGDQVTIGCAGDLAILPIDAGHARLVCPGPSAIPTVAPTPTSTPAPTPTATPTPVPTPAGTIVPATKGALASAIAAAHNGDTLLLRGGTHVVSSMIVTAKALTLRAYPGETPVVTDAGGRPDLLYLEGGPVTIDGLTFATSAASGTYDDSQGSALLELRGAAHDVTIRNSRFVGSAAMATRQQLVYVAGKSATLRNLAIIDTELDANGTRGYGVHVYGDNSSGPAVDGFTIARIVGRDFGTNHAVVFWAREANATLTDSDFYGGNAVRYHLGTSVAITDNRGHDVDAGLTIDSSAGLTQHGNDWTLP